MSYKSEFQANNVDLQGLIDTVKTLPVARNDALFLEEKNSELGTGSWRGISYGNGRFVAIQDNSINNVYSDDGFTWIESHLPESRYWSNIGYYGDKFIAFAQQTSQYAYSEDGVTWIKSDKPFYGYYKTPCAYGNEKYVILSSGTYSGSNQAAYSSDGITWTTTTLPVSGRWNSITYGNGKFVAVGCNLSNGTSSASNIYVYSTDGVTWSSGTMPVSATWNGIIYYNNLFVALASNGIGAYSADGISWTNITTPITTVTELACGNDICVTISYNSNFVAYSTDGINWKESTLPASAKWYSVTYGEGKFVAIAYDLATAAISYDGIEWFFEDTLIVDVNDNDVTEETVLATGALDDALFLSEKKINETEVYFDNSTVVFNEDAFTGNGFVVLSNIDESLKDKIMVPGINTGEKYTFLVTLDGVEYECEPYANDGFHMGDPNFETYPFVIDAYIMEEGFGIGGGGVDNTYMEWDAIIPQSGTHSLKIERIIDSELKKVIVDINDNDVTEEVTEIIGVESEEIGDIKITARTDLGDNWILCDGTQISREVYSELGGIIPSSLIDAWTNKDIWTGGTRYTYINCITYANGYWVVGGQYYDGSKCYARIAYSTTLEGTWTVKDLWSGNIAHTTAGSTNAIFCVTYALGYWVFGGQQYTSSYHRATIAYTTNLTTTPVIKNLWSSSSSGQSYDETGVRSIIYANGYWVAGGIRDGSTPSGYMAYTTNLVDSWSTYSPTLRSVRSVVYDGTYWIICGYYYSSKYYARVGYSTSLNSGWTYTDLWNSTNSSTECKDVDFINNYYVAIGIYGTTDPVIKLAYTTSLTGTWTIKDLWTTNGDPTYTKYNITYADGYWVIGGSYNDGTCNYARIAYTADLTGEWTYKDIWDSSATTSAVQKKSCVNHIDYINNQWVICGAYDASTGRIAYIDKNLITLPTLSFDNVNTYIKVKE